MTNTDVLEVEELEALLAQPNRRYPSGARNYALLQLMAQTGIRCGEALQVEEKDIKTEMWGNNGDKQKIPVLRLRKKTTKGKKERVGIPLTPRTLEALQEWQEHRQSMGIEGGPLFCTITTGMAGGFGSSELTQGGPLSSRYVREVVRRYAEKAGIGKRVHPHMLRHSALTSLYEKTLDLRLVQTVAGHASSKTTERYTHVHPLRIAQAMGVV